MRHPLQRAALFRVTAVAVAAALSACGGDDATDDPPATAAMTNPVQHTSLEPPLSTAPTVPSSAAPAPSGAPTSTTPSSTLPPTLIEIADQHLAFTVALPDEHAVRASGTDDFVGDGSCIGYWWRLNGGVVVEAWPASCDPANSEPGNGSYGHYRTLADAPSPVPTGSVETVLGPATLGEQVYYECTNSCREWPLDIAVIELSEPVDGEYPTLIVITTDPDATTDDLVTLLAAFGAG